MKYPNLLRLLTMALAALAARGASAAPLIFEAAPPTTGDSVVSTFAFMPAPALDGTSLALTTYYDGRDWSGGVRAWRVDARTGTLSALPEWDSAARLDAADPNGRTVLTHDGSTGLPLRWDRLPAAVRKQLADPDGTAAGRARVDWMRGDHRQEAARGGLLRDRIRQSDGRPFRQADIVNAQAWPTGRPATLFAQAGFSEWRRDKAITGRPSMVYVAGNDGLLHGFDARSGDELLAYLPRGLLPQIAAFSRPGWQHGPLMGGPVFTADANIPVVGQTTRWATVLAGAPGSGGPGYFVLDVSRPDQFSELGAASIVLLDTTVTADPDIGHIVSPPVADERGTGAAQITRLNNGRWALVLGNGVNSPDEMPVLLIQYLDGLLDMRRIRPKCPALPAPCAYRGSNGLSAPALIDVDGDGKADLAYAGDLRGNLWKFDLSQDDADQWKIAFGGQPFFTARDDDGRPQPISAAPGWMPHPRGGVALSFGTGRMLTAADRSDTQVQSLYGLHDDSEVLIGPPSLSGDRSRITINEGLPVNRPQDKLRPASLLVLNAGAASSVQGRAYQRTEASAVEPADARGWRMDLPQPGERLLQTPRILGGQRMLFATTAGASDYLTVIDAATGRTPATPTFKALASLPVAAGDAARTANRVATGSSGLLLMRQGADWSVAQPSGSALPVLALRHGSTKPLRVGWKQLR